MVIKVTNDGPVRVITFNHRSSSNPFSRNLQVAVTQAALDASADDTVKAVIFTGGTGRSFSAGGDFNEVRQLSSPQDVDKWIDTFMDMYLAILRIPKPTFGAIEGYAIGIGFQVALMLDWRIMSKTAKISIPELRHGIGGSVGGAILTALYGADVARETMLGALEFGADEALLRHFVQEISSPSTVMSVTLEKALDRAQFASESYKNTKSAICQPTERALLECIDVSKKVHRAAFERKAMASHFENILSRSRHNSTSN